MTDTTATTEMKLPWGRASDGRGTSIDGNGKSFTQHAIDFAEEFPLGSFLIRETFDEWLAAAKLLTIPPIDAPKDSDAWLGHLQRRHILYVKLNKACSHPRMAEYGIDPFILTAIRGGYEVCTPTSEVINSKITKKFQSITETKRKQLKELMQGADWSKIPYQEKEIAIVIYDDIRDFAEATKHAADLISKKLVRLQNRVERLLGRPVDLDKRWAEVERQLPHPDDGE
jgi:hypothetical protein